MYFSLQGRTIFRGWNVQKWSETVSFLTFSLANVLLATAACHFSTSERPKVLRTRLATAARHFSTSELQKWSMHAVFCTFWLKMRFSPQRRAIFRHQNFKKWPEHVARSTFWLENALLPTAACNFPCLVSTATSALPSLLFDPADPQIIEKTKHFAASLTFCASISSFFWLSRSSIFFLLTLRLLSAFSSSFSASLLCFFNCPYCQG